MHLLWCEYEEMFSIRIYPLFLEIFIRVLNDSIKRNISTLLENKIAKKHHFRIFVFIFVLGLTNHKKNTSANWTIESGVKILPENFESRGWFITRGLTQTAVLRKQGASGILYERVDFIT